MPRVLALLGTLLVGFLAGVVLAMTPASSNGVGLPQKAVQNSSAPPASERPSIAEQSALGIISLATVGPLELPRALATMDLPGDAQVRVADDVKAGKYKLVWLTLWDWDGDEISDHVTIVSGDYRRTMELPKLRTTVAVPDPPSSSIEITGDPHNVGYGGWTTLGLLSGARPIALSRMVPGSTVRLDVDTSN